MTVHKENIICAIILAIEARREAEKKAGFTKDSALVAGWVATQKALEDGDILYLI